MQHVLSLQNTSGAAFRRLIGKIAVGQPYRPGETWGQRPQCGRRSIAITLKFCVGVPRQHEVMGQRLKEREARHLRVGSRTQKI